MNITEAIKNNRGKVLGGIAALGVGAYVAKRLDLDDKVVDFLKKEDVVEPEATKETLQDSGMTMDVASAQELADKWFNPPVEVVSASLIDEGAEGISDGDKLVMTYNYKGSQYVRMWSMNDGQWSSTDAEEISG